MSTPESSERVSYSAFALIGDALMFHVASLWKNPDRIGTYMVIRS